MKKQFLFLVALIGCLYSFGQETDAFKKIAVFNLNSINEKLFGGTAVKKNEFMWKPDFQELFAFSQVVSYDGYCHTKIDTAFSIKSYGNNYVLIIYATFRYETKNEVSDCHGCSVVLSAALIRDAPDKTSYVEQFEKGFTSFGSYGTGGSYSIEKIGKDKFALALKSGFTGQGNTTESKTYYNIDPYASPYLTKLFSYDTELSSDMGSTETNTLSTLPNPKSDYFDFVLTNKKDGKVSPVKRRYAFYEEGGIYIPAK